MQTALAEDPAPLPDHPYPDGGAPRTAGVAGESPPIAVHHGLAIAVLERGWVYVGRCTVGGGWLLIEDARNVRRWGTTAGLGQLAASGPTKSTVLDLSPAVRVPLASLIHLIACEPSAWPS